MLLRLRHAFPILQTLSNGWAASATVPPLVRPLARAAAAASSGAHSPADGEPVSPNEPGAAPSSSEQPPIEEPKQRKRRSATGSSSGTSRSKGSSVTTPAAAAAPSAEAASSPAVAAAAAAGDSTEAAQSTAEPGAPPKRRTSSRRKAAAADTAAEGDGPAAGAVQAAGGGEAQDAAAAAPAPAPAKRGRKKKADAVPAPDPAAAAAEVAGDTAAAATAAEAAADTAAAATVATVEAGDGAKRRTTKRASKKAAAGAGAAEADAGAAEEEQAHVVTSLPFEDFFILPRKAEQVLVALGLRHPPGTAPAASGAGGPAGGGAAAAAAGVAGGVAPPGRSLRNVAQIREFLGWGSPRDLASPLLLASYQGYLAPGEDYLYDLFCLDFGDIASSAIIDAVSEAGCSARSLLSASTGAPPESLMADARRRVEAAVGPEAAARQERGYPGFLDAQLTLFLMDFASACLVGRHREGRDTDVSYASRRCAALLLVKPSVQERLTRYCLAGAALDELAVAGGRGGGGGGGRSVRLAQPMDALLEGLKAGVRLDRERLLADFRLGPDDPLRPHLPELMARVGSTAVALPEPGSKSFYDLLVQKLTMQPHLGTAIRQQEQQWSRDQGDKPGSNTLTMLQLRLLFHLWRRDQFAGEAPRKSGFHPDNRRRDPAGPSDGDGDGGGA